VIVNRTPAGEPYRCPGGFAGSDLVFGFRRALSGSPCRTVGPSRTTLSKPLVRFVRPCFRPRPRASRRPPSESPLVVDDMKWARRAGGTSVTSQCTGTNSTPARLRRSIKPRTKRREGSERPSGWRLALSCDEPLIELEGSREQKVAKIAKKESRQCFERRQSSLEHVLETANVVASS
jgi:hypothetical protein